jgi:tape measure domain-containing protein
MADLATLQIKVDASNAIRNTERLSGALENVAEQGPLVSAALGKTEAQIRKLQTAETAAYREADRMAQSLNKVEKELKDVNRETQSVRSSFGSLRTMFAAIAGSMIVREFVQMADTSRLLEGRLKLVTSSAGELASVQDALFASAQRTRTAFVGNVELYARVARATKDLGISQRDLLQFTELTNMAIKTSGATSSEAGAALIQLSQGLSAGVLRGEEFNSVMEQTPAIAQALAASLGVGIGQLRAMAQQGQLTSQVVIDGILKANERIRNDFATAPKTVSDAWETSKNEILRALGELDRATNASTFFSKLLSVPGFLATGIGEMLPQTKRKAAQRADDQAFAYRQAFLSTEEGQRQQTAENALKAEADRAAQQKANIEAMRDYAGELVKLSEFVKLNASQLQILRNADASYAVSLRDGSLAIEDRIALLARQRAGENALMLAQRQSLEAQSASALARLRSGLGRSGETSQQISQSAGLVGLQARQAPLLVAKTLLDKQAKMEMEAREKSLLAEHQLRENLQIELAKNFRENMQRAFGDVLTEFVTKGKVSIGGLFDSLKQIGGSMVGQGIGKMLSGSLLTKMTPFGSLFAGGALALVGNLFGRRRRPSAGQDGNEQARFEAGEAARREREQEMRDFVAGRNGGRGGVIQSVGQVLQETSASRMIGELVAIRVATTRTADAVAGGTLTGGAGTTVNVTVQGGAAGNLNGVAEQVADAVDRLLGTRVQGLRLTSGSAVTI